MWSARLRTVGLVLRTAAVAWTGLWFVAGASLLVRHLFILGSLDGTSIGA